jgi:hypothetical protein
MFRGIRLTLVVVGLLVLAGGGVSIFRLPDHEVVFATPPPIIACTKSGCLFIYTLEVGNTGRQDQEDVRVRVRGDVVRAAILPPKVRNFGKVDRPVDIHDEDGVRTFDLGRLKTQGRVELTFVLRYKDRQQAPSWRQILVAVEPASGDARAGDPASITLGRVLYRIFGSWG